MKFSIIIPTQNRPELLALAVKHVINQGYKDIELIVSDNSTTSEMRNRNKLLLESHIQNGDLLLVVPQNILCAPKNFDYGLQFATGDYVLFLTDKMLLMRNTLDTVFKLIQETSADLINWRYCIFSPDNYLKPENEGYIDRPLPFSGDSYHEYDPLKHLKFKASGVLPRPLEDIDNYVKGKICFGCYSKELISRIVAKSGSMYGGVTHDYSAMIQALCLAKKCVLLEKPGILFVSLPSDKSTGSLTNLHSVSALEYYQSFKDYKFILNELLVPGVYASLHNMVAHDYVKYLKLYNKQEILVEKNWLNSIAADLYLPGRVWKDKVECKKQFRLFHMYFYNRKKLLMLFAINFRIWTLSVKKMLSVGFRTMAKKLILLLGAPGKKIISSCRQFLMERESGLDPTRNKCISLEEAVKSITVLGNV